MAVSNSAVAKLWDAEALQRLRYVNEWRRVVRDRSAALMGRKELVLTDVKRDITLNARATNDADFGAVGVPDAAGYTLTKDKQYDWNEGISFQDELETAPSLAEAVGIWSTNTVSNKVSSDIRAKVDAATPRQTFDVAVKVDGTADEATLINAAGGKLVADLFVDVQEYMDGIGAPLEGRFAMCHPRIRAAFTRYLMENGRDRTPGSLAYQEFMGQHVDSPLGFMVFTDRSIPGVSSAAGNNQFKTYFGVAGLTIDFAEQINWSDIIRDPDGPRYLYQGLMAYGALVTETITASATTPYSDVAANTKFNETLMLGQFDVTA